MLSIKSRSPWEMISAVRGELIVNGMIRNLSVLFTTRQTSKRILITSNVNLPWSDLDYEQSLFFLGPSRKTPETRKWPRAWLKARDGRGTTKERRPGRDSLFFLLGLPPSFLASRSFAAQRSRARALPLLNLKKKRGKSLLKRLNTGKYILLFS